MSKICKETAWKTTVIAHQALSRKLDDEKRSRQRVEEELKEVEKDRDEFKRKLDAERKKQVCLAIDTSNTELM